MIAKRRAMATRKKPATAKRRTKHAEETWRWVLPIVVAVIMIVLIWKRLIY